MEDVFDVLAEDHEEIRQALAELEKGPTAATGATEDQLMLRKIMTEELIIEEAKHGEQHVRDYLRKNLEFTKLASDEIAEILFRSEGE